MTWYDDRGARADTSTLVRTHSHSDDAKDRRDESQHTPRPRARIGRVPLMIGIVLLALLIGGGAALALTRGGSNDGTGGQPGTSGSGGSTTGRKPGTSGSIAVPASFSITGRAHFHFPALRRRTRDRVRRQGRRHHRCHMHVEPVHGGAQGSGGRSGAPSVQRPAPESSRRRSTSTRARNAVRSTPRSPTGCASPAPRPPTRRTRPETSPRRGRAEHCRPLPSTPSEDRSSPTTDSRRPPVHRLLPPAVSASSPGKPASATGP